jgi:predicted unusual protein kinase regulating ubiquinone biosynthesis (AarF/ABC1/UbiB family)
LDFGIFGEFDERMRRLTSLLMNSLVRGDLEMATHYLLRMATLAPDANPEAFRKEIGACYQTWRGSTVSEFGFAKLLYEELSLGVKHGIIFPDDMVLFGKAMLTIEGVILAVDPEMDLSKEAAPFMKKVRADLFSTERLSQALERSLPLWWELAESLPRTLPPAIERVLQEPPSRQPAAALSPARVGLAEATTIASGAAMMIAEVGPAWRGVPLLGVAVLTVGVAWAMTGPRPGSARARRQRAQRPRGG